MTGSRAEIEHCGSVRRALALRDGYAMTSGFEDLLKVNDNCWRFRDEDCETSVLGLAEAAEVLEAVFPER